MQFHDVHLHARQQHGVVSLKQLSRSCSRKQRDRLIKQGFLSKIRRGGVLLAGIKQAWEQNVHAAQLVVPHAVVSHRSAGRIWGISDVDCPLVEVVVEHKRHARKGIKVHTTDCLPTRHIREHKGFLITTPERTLIDLAAVLLPRALERALEEALRLGITSPERIAAELQIRRGSGHRGTRRLAQLLLPILMTPPELQSWLERRTWCWIKKSDLPLPKRQMRFELNGSPAYPDFTWPEFGVIVEADGAQWHNNLTAFHRDKRRDLAFDALGFHVIRVTHKTKRQEFIAAMKNRLC